MWTKGLMWKLVTWQFEADCVFSGRHVSWMYLDTRGSPAGEIKSNVSNRFDANWNLVTLMKQVQTLVTYQKFNPTKLWRESSIFPPNQTQILSTGSQRRPSPEPKDERDQGHRSLFQAIFYSMFPLLSFSLFYFVFWCAILKNWRKVCALSLDFDIFIRKVKLERIIGGSWGFLVDFV